MENLIDFLLNTNKQSYLCDASTGERQVEAPTCLQVEPFQAGHVLVHLLQIGRVLVSRFGQLPVGRFSGQSAVHLLDDAGEESLLLLFRLQTVAHDEASVFGWLVKSVVEQLKKQSLKTHQEFKKASESEMELFSEPELKKAQNKIKHIFAPSQSTVH